MIEKEKEQEGKIKARKIKVKDVEIKNLEDQLIEANPLISSIQQENMQLKVNEMMLDKHTIVLKKEYTKGKAVVQMKVSNGKGKLFASGRPKTRVAKRDFEQQRETSPPKKLVMVDDLIARNINGDRVYWLDKVNGYLE